MYPCNQVAQVDLSLLFGGWAVRGVQLSVDQVRSSRSERLTRFSVRICQMAGGWRIGRMEGMAADGKSKGSEKFPYSGSSITIPFMSICILLRRGQMRGTQGMVGLAYLSSPRSTLGSCWPLHWWNIRGELLRAQATVLTYFVHKIFRVPIAGYNHCPITSLQCCQAPTSRSQK